VQQRGDGGYLSTLLAVYHSPLLAGYESSLLGGYECTRQLLVYCTRRLLVYSPAQYGGECRAPTSLGTLRVLSSRLTSSSVGP
jgi:hypothetical protein